MKKKTIAKIRSMFKKGEKFKGFVVGNKVNSFHFFGGWHLASSFEAATLEEFMNHKNSFEFYLESELGNRAAIYITK